MENANDQQDDDRPISVIMELINGPLDGTTYIFEDKGHSLKDLVDFEHLDGSAAFKDLIHANLGLLMYHESQNGTVGQRCFPPCGEETGHRFPLSMFYPKTAGLEVTFDRQVYQRHEYVITDRLADGNEVLVRAQYVGATNDSSVTFVGRVSAVPFSS